MKKMDLDVQTVLNNMPKLISKCVSLMDTIEEKLMGLYTAIAISSGLIPFVWFNYDNKKTYTQIMVLIVFPPASGKGKVNLFFRLVGKINQEQISYNNDQLKAYNIALERIKRAKKGDEFEVPTKPILKLITIPGNTTSSKLIEQLAENNGEMCALILESEIDGLTTMMTNQHGKDNSMILRKAFHNETISQMRKNNAEHLVVNNPKLAVVITGTPSQVKSLFQSNQDGAFSRFTVLQGYAKTEWKDVKPCEECHPLDEQFDKMGDVFYAIYHHFKNKEIEVKFTDEQWQASNEFGEKWLKYCEEEGGEYATSIAKRHINMLARIAATITILRNFEDKNNDAIVYCTDEDFLGSFWLVELSLQNALTLFKDLPGEKTDKTNDDEVFDLLPESFKRCELMPLLKIMNIADRSLTRKLEKFVANGKLKLVKKGYYKKALVADMAVGQL